MKDSSDSGTKDIFTNSNPVGRPRKYATNADRQKAYRQRNNIKSRAPKPQVINVNPLNLMSRIFYFKNNNPSHPMLENIGLCKVVAVVLHEKLEPELGLRPTSCKEEDYIEFYTLSDLTILSSCDNKLADMPQQNARFDMFTSIKSGQLTHLQYSDQ